MFRNLIDRLLKREGSNRRRKLSRSERRAAFLSALQSRTSAEVATWTNAFRNIVNLETRRRGASFQSYLMPALQLEALEERVLLATDITFLGNAAFQGDGAGDMAATTIDGVSVAFTTQATIGGTLATQQFGLGLSGGAEAEEFDANPTTLGDAGESWTFDADTHLFFEGVEFGSLSSNEFFDVQSDRWINLHNISPSNASVSYAPATGTFTFTDDPDDTFTIDDMTGGIPLDVPPGTDVSITFRSAASVNDHATLDVLTLSAPFVVTNNNDSGAGSFRNALIASQAAGNNGIVFAPGLAGQTIMVASDLPVFAASQGDLAIIGLKDVSGAPNVTIQAASATVDGLDWTSAGASSQALSISDLIIRDFDGDVGQSALGFLGTRLNVDNVHFLSNGGTDGNNFGGAILMGDSNAALTATISNSIFGGNKADGGGQGGAVHSLNSGNGVTLNISNSLFYENTATGAGGVGGAIVADGTPVTIVNSTIVDNNATTDGGLRATGGATYTLQNTIVTNNTGGDVTAGFTQTTSLVGASVDFVDAANDNYRLAATATNAIDQGTDALATAAGLTTDLDGNTRFVGTVDIGAFEFMPAPAATLIVDAGGGGDHTTIQAAVNAAGAGDTIQINSGTYNESVDVSAGPGSLSFIGNDTGTGLPLIDGNAAPAFFTTAETADYTFDSLRLQNAASGTDNHSIRLLELTGTVQVLGSTFVSSEDDGVFVRASGTVQTTAFISGNTFLDVNN